MSTRSQVKVIQAGLEWKEQIMLYHHTDGYPTYMLKKIAEAFRKGSKPKKYGTCLVSRAWELGRAGKAASWLCAVDPGVFEPEIGIAFHSDIEWYYEIVAVNHDHGSMAENPTWNVRVFATTNGFWDNPDRKHMTLVAEGDILKLAKEAEKIQDSVN